MLGLGLSLWNAALGGGGGAPFDPASLSSIYNWLDAGAGVFTDTGLTAPAVADDAIAGWQCQAGTGRNWTQAVAGNRPQLKTGIVNGRPVIRFVDGGVVTTNDYFAGPDISALTAAHMFCVVAAAEDPGTDLPGAALWRFGSAVTSTLYPYNADSVIYDQFGTTDRKITGDPTPDLAAFHLYEIVSVSGEWTSLFDGVQHYTTGTNTVGFTATPLIGNITEDFGFSGDIAEIILCNAKLTGNDLTNVRSYLSTKYAL